MTIPQKPSRLGRGLDALLARKEPPKAALTGSTSDEQLPSNSRNDSKTATLPTVPNTSAQDVSETSVSKANAPERSAAAVTLDQSVDGPQPQLRLVSIAQIAANPFQPRKEFRPDELADLESSLKQIGLLQPITVRQSPHHSGYELIAGERRLRAATRLGWTEIPALVRETDDRTMLTLAMVENLQRTDLDPIEEADGYQRLVEEFNLTQQEVADVVGKDRSTVANALRLLSLPASVRRMLQERQITVGHARALLPLGAERAMADLAREVAAKTLSVRDVEKRVRAARPSPAKSGRKLQASNATGSEKTSASTAETRRIEELLRQKLQTAVTLHLTALDRGELRIAFHSNEDFERVLSVLGIHLDN